VDAPRTLAAADGTRIAWRVEGEGDLVVLVNGLANDAYQFGTLRRRLAATHRVVTWDHRGHGESEPARDPATFDLRGAVDDLARVVEAAAEPGERATLIGYSLGCQVAYEAWRSFPERIGCLVHILGTFERPFDTLYNRPIGVLGHLLLRALPGPVFTAMFRGSPRSGPLSFVAGRAIRAVEPGVSYTALKGFTDQMGRLDGPSFRALALGAQQHSARDVLPTIDVPLLVITGGLDVMAPPAIGDRIEQLVPHCQRVHLKRAGHTGLLGHGEEIAHLVEGFLDRLD
jgi:pimeloyl-ACP methyl ester carboxylesterase